MASLWTLIVEQSARCPSLRRLQLRGSTAHRMSLMVPKAKQTLSIRRHSRRSVSLLANISAVMLTNIRACLNISKLARMKIELAFVHISQRMHPIELLISKTAGLNVVFPARGAYEVAECRDIALVAVHGHVEFFGIAPGQLRRWRTRGCACPEHVQRAVEAVSCSLSPTARRIHARAASCSLAYVFPRPGQLPPC